MNHKEVNRQVYDRYAQEFQQITQSYLTKHILKDVKLFMSSLKGKRILDLGSGPGRDSQFFKEKGLNPLCLDISPEMIKLCQEKGLEAQVGDLEKLPFEDSSFDGVWAYTSLLHVPKNKFGEILTKINNILTPQGIFYLGMKEGDFEGMVKSEKYGESERFFSLYRDSELRKILSQSFSITHSSRVELGEAVFLNYLCKNKGIRNP